LQETGYVLSIFFLSIIISSIPLIQTLRNTDNHLRRGRKRRLHSLQLRLWPLCLPISTRFNGGGDLISEKYSIFGADSHVPGTLDPAGGLDKHGVFEIDGSITRQDTYFGNNANFILQRWEEYVEIANRNRGQFGAET